MIIPKIPKYKAYALYKLMYFFDEFCKEHDITYWIEAGTIKKGNQTYSVYNHRTVVD